MSIPSAGYNHPTVKIKGIIRIVGIIGGVLLLCAGILSWVQYDDHHNGNWFPNLFDAEIDSLVAWLLLIGLGLIIFAIRWYIYVRERRD